MNPYTIHPLAEGDLDGAIGHYESKRTGLGLEFEAEFRRTLGLIRENPKIGALYRRTSVRHFGLRRFPYVLYYEDLESGVHILAGVVDLVTG